MAVSQNFPDEGPSLNLNFAGSRTLDSRVSFTRSSSATYMNENGLITLASADSPRFDHSYDGNDVQSMGLLIEESRTNLLTYSEQLTNGVYTLTGCAVTTATGVLAPDGSTNVYKINANNGVTSRVAIGQTITSTLIANVGVKFAGSLFVKAAEAQYATLWFDGGTAGAGYAVTEGPYYGSTNVIDLQTGLTATGAASTTTQIKKYPNGWLQLSIVGTSATTSAITKTLRLSVGGPNGYNEDPTTGYVGTGTNGIYVWGWQFEQGSFPTSYIPTTTSTVTRSEDRAVIDGSKFTDFYNQNEGTFFYNGKTTLDKSGNNTWYFAVGRSTTNRIGVYQDFAGSSGILVPYIVKNSVVVGVATANVGISSDIKFALSYQTGVTTSFSFYYNGISLVSSQAISGIDTGANQLIIGSYLNQIASHYPTDLPIKQFTYYPKKLSDAQLETLTK
jgi:hypothetical protein